MNNHIEVNHSNNVTIHYDEVTYQGPGGDPPKPWLVLGLSAVIVLTLTGQWLFLAIVGAIAGIVALCKAASDSMRRHQTNQAAIAARADDQRAAIARGDMVTGLYGIYTPAPTHEGEHIGNVDQGR